jgi:hypothetical protein
MRRTLPYLYIALLFTVSCRKEPLPEEIPADPVFRAGFTADGVPVEIKAGINGYSMTPSFSKDSTNTFVFTGKLDQSGCSGCGWSISILLNDYKPSGNFVTNIDSSLYIGEHVFEGKATQSDIFDAQFTSVRNQVASYEEFKWTVADGTQTTQATGTSLNATLKAGKTYTVTLSYNDGLGNCNTVHTRVFKPGNPLQFNAKAQRTGLQSELNYSFSCEPFITGYQYHWEFGDGSASDVWTATHKYSENGASYPAYLRITNNKGDTCIAHYQVPGSLSTECDANFNARITPVLNPRRYGAVTVILTDPAGEVYTTRDIVQPTGSSFFLQDQAAYENQVTSAKARKISVAFNCLLQGKTRTVALTQGSAVIAVSYP